MPYFIFKGLGLSGSMVTGIREAAHSNELKDLLLKEQIALLSFREKRTRLAVNWLPKKRIKESDIALLFSFLASLLVRGVSLSSALLLFIQQTSNASLKQIVDQLYQHVTRGGTIAECLQKHPTLFSPFIIQLVETGERTGKLDTVLREAAAYIEKRVLFKASIRKAAMLPLVTLAFALGIMLVIFIFIIPQFEVLFSVIEKPLPPSTKVILRASHIVQSRGFFLILATIPIQALCVRYFIRQTFGRAFVETFMLLLPGIRSCYQIVGMISFLTSLQLFIKSGFTVKQAFEQAQLIVQRPVLQKKLSLAGVALNHGATLAQALRIHVQPDSDENTIQLLTIGEQSVNIEGMLGQSITLLEQRLQYWLNLVSTTIQPLLLIVIGFFIGALLVVTYKPIFSLSTAF